MSDSVKQTHVILTLLLHTVEVLYSMCVIECVCVCMRDCKNPKPCI